ncbi:hypothetical protein M3I54_22710 [Paraburkholderia sp. CNPSo 3274]|uniref:hypothetical protein n=1 Tax=Paraburkholderia sp. CNPSo 3274 TaxID=2940932 RepID=UPI0020B6DFA1|nr:hypothetical protein [Paraburkholderia sp. CNPSo 3274]MCP3709759.1 hypothetical protein [Paraburkholderia sp. CNPSo 3274]
MIDSTYTASDFKMALVIRTALCVLFGVFFAAAVLCSFLEQPLIDVLFPFWR